MIIVKSKKNKLKMSTTDITLKISLVPIKSINAMYDTLSGKIGDNYFQILCEEDISRDFKKNINVERHTFTLKFTDVKMSQLLTEILNVGINEYYELDSIYPPPSGGKYFKFYVTPHIKSNYPKQQILSNSTPFVNDKYLKNICSNTTKSVESSITIKDLIPRSTRKNITPHIPPITGLLSTPTVVKSLSNVTTAQITECVRDIHAEESVSGIKPADTDYKKRMSHLEEKLNKVEEKVGPYVEVREKLEYAEREITHLEITLTETTSIVNKLTLDNQNVSFAYANMEGYYKAAIDRIEADLKSRTSSYFDLLEENKLLKQKIHYYESLNMTPYVLVNTETSNTTPSNST